MIIEGFRKDISEFEDLLQKIVTDITSGVIFERLPPAEIWNRSESSATTLRDLAERIRENMLLLKPERTATIEARFKAVLDPLNAFKDVLFQKTGQPVANARQALEQLRRSAMEGSELAKLAKEIESNPSEVISEVLRLREVYGAKEYLSAIPVPELVHNRLLSLNRHIGSLRSYISHLEKALGEAKAQLDAVEEEIRKFHPSSTEQSGESEKEEETVIESSEP
ncbi:MAG: hypothetical protein ACETWE_01235 [Candidatus Bathyarchaeia archaeon]